MANGLLKVLVGSDPISFQGDQIQISANHQTNILWTENIEAFSDQINDKPNKDKKYIWAYRILKPWREFI